MPSERARGVIGGVGEQPDRLRFEVDQFSGCVALRLFVDKERGCVPSKLVPVGGWSAVVVLGDGFDVLGDVGLCDRFHPFRPLAVRRVDEDGFDLLVARVHAQHRGRAYRFLVVLLRLFEEGRTYPAAPADAPGVLLKRCPDAFDRVVDPFAGDRFVVRDGWISSCSGRSVGGAFSSRRRVPIVFDPGRSAARHRAVVECRFLTIPSSAAWTNVRLDVRPAVVLRARPALLLWGLPQNLWQN